MTDAPLPASLETLLAHREWVRRVAKALTADEHLAADIEQDVWLAAIERPPRVRGSLRGWLAAALRHDLFDRRRAESRRFRREEAAARPEAATAADLVESAEAHRRVVNAVMELAEPYRSTVLLRWYEELGPSEIAARQGVPVETVRTRLKRAIGQLRERFDSESGGDRSAWTLGMLPLVRGVPSAGHAAPVGAAGTVAGGIVMSASAKAALAAGALLLLGGGAWWATRGDSVRPPVPDETAVAPGDSPRPSATAERAPRRRASDESGSAATAAVAAGAAAKAGEARRTPDPPPAVDFPDGPAKSGEVAGRVLLLPGRTPVAGAAVHLVGGGQPEDVAPLPKPGTATTGTNGVFRIGGLRPGVYAFEAKAAGHTPRTFTAKIEASAGVDVDVLLGCGGSVEGRVFGGTGPEAGVEIAINRSGIGGGPGLLSCRTDAEGKYRFDDLPDGRYSVEVRGQGFRGRSASVQVTADKVARLDFAGGASLIGRVTDAGSPVAGAIVRVSGGTGEDHRNSQVNTDQDGAFRIDGLAPGKADVGIQLLGADQYAINVHVATLAAGENRVDVRIGDGNLAGEISGRVYAKETGTPLAGNDVQIAMSVLVEREDGTWTPGSYAGMAFADTKGAFRVRAVRPGRYRLNAVPKGVGGLASTQVDVDVAYGQRRTGVDIPLPKAAPRESAPSASVLTGTLTDAAGRPVPGALVRLTRVDDEKRVRRGDTDDTGRYRIEKLEPGTWRVELQVIGGEGFGAVVAEPTLAAGPNALDIRLAAEEVAGRVVARSSGEPLPFPSVQLGLYVVGPDGKRRYVGVAFPAKDGSFRFRAIPTGTLEIVASPTSGGLKAKSVRVDVAPGRSVSGLEIALDELATGVVVFVVRDEKGQAVPDFVIESMRDGKPEQGSGDIVGATNGVHESHFEAGPHTVTVRNESETRSATVDIDVREGETTRVEVVLRPVR